MATTYYSSDVRPSNVVTQIITYLLRILEVLLALRFFLKLFGANPGAGFTNFIYSLSQPFVAPFSNVFGNSVVQNAAGISVFEWTTLLAMIVYWIIAAILVRLASIGSQPVVIRHAHAYEDDADLDIDDDDRV
jgi:hypothetical protein